MIQLEIEKADQATLDSEAKWSDEFIENKIYTLLKGVLEFEIDEFIDIYLQSMGFQMSEIVSQIKEGFGNGYSIQIQIELLGDAVAYAAKKAKELPDVEQLQHEGDWFWIPSDKVEVFSEMSKLIEGITYMDKPDVFDDFENKFGHYRTGGDKGNMPSYFKQQ